MKDEFWCTWEPKQNVTYRSYFLHQMDLLEEMMGLPAVVPTFRSNHERDSRIHTAVWAWFEDPAAAKAKYGPIASWDVSEVTNLDALFEGRIDFNGDLSHWEVGQVKYMHMMFAGATSFTHQLGGTWATSTARKDNMFYNSPGTIAGKVKDADGTIA